MEDGRYLTPENLVLTPENDYQMSAHHYIIEDKLSQMVFYDYLLSDCVNLKGDGVYLIRERVCLTFWEKSLKEDDYSLLSDGGYLMGY